MSVQLISRRLLGSGVLCLAIVGLCLDRGAAAGTAATVKPEDLATAKFYGVETCKGCHKSKGERKDDLVMLTEYETWRTQDKHSVAYAVLEGPRGQRMSQLLGKDGQPFKVTEAAVCLNCHATNVPEGRQHKPNFSLKDGVSCDACHGPAQYWYEDHQLNPLKWRPMSPKEKEAQGMYNVRDPARRARLCLSCHVGSPAEGKVVTHAMYAAGHPPLQGFELASFTERMPPHWYNLKDVKYLQGAGPDIQEKYYYDRCDSVHTRSVLAGSLASFRTALDALAVRARLDTKAAQADELPAQGGWPPAWLGPGLKSDLSSRFPELISGPQAGRSQAVSERWPELAMAQADCYACHHDLKSSASRPLGGGFLARVGPPAWPLALLNTGLVGYGRPAKPNPLASLDHAYEEHLFGAPAQLAPASFALAKWADDELLNHSPRPINAQLALRLLRELCDRPKDQAPDYDSARQIAWAFRAIFREWPPTATGNLARANQILKGWEEALNLDPDIARDRRKQLIVKELGNERLAVLMEDKDKRIDPKVLYESFFVRLQEIHDQEWAEAAKRRDEYDAAAFTASLRELAGLLK
jgi:hypothetical protein